MSVRSRLAALTPIRSLRRVGLALGVAVAVTTLSIAPASAHTTVSQVVVGTCKANLSPPGPGDGSKISIGKCAKVTTSPKKVELVFGVLGTVIQNGTLKVVNAKGKQVSIGTGGRDPQNVRVLLANLKKLASGTYRATAAWVASDGHRQSQTFTFTVKLKKK